MSSKRRKLRYKTRRRRFALEALEPRVVLDGQLGVEVGNVIAGEPSGFEKFESADEMQQFLIAKAVDQWADLFGTETQRWPYIDYFLEDGIRGTLPRLAQSDSKSVAGASFDSTNIQVGGVDEADVVKTDGEYLYIANDSRLTIVDARDATNLTVAAELSLDSYSSELFVSGDRLAVLSHEFGLYAYSDVLVADSGFAPHEPYRPTTSVAIYDISDPASPTLVSDTTLDGTLNSSRRIDDVVYLVTSNSLNLPQLEMQCEDNASKSDDAKTREDGAQGFGATVTRDLLIAPPFPWPDERQTCTYESEQEYLTRIEDDILEMSLASFEVTDASGEVIDSGFVTEVTDTYKPVGDDAFNLNSVIVVDMTSDSGGITDSTSVMTGYGSTVYASSDNLYLASTSSSDTGTATTLHQFSVGDEGASVDLRAVGSVPGTLLNQFSLDEHDGNLRVVTSQGWGDDRINSLFVLESADAELNVIGSIDEIATGESVFAVRFLGDEAFVVTFRVIDPLFTIDLSDPTNPIIEGELKIPGFSNYLHPISEDLLIGLGRDDGGWRGNPQLSLFDVSDFTQPERIDNFEFERVNWSEAFYNHHAINYFADTQVAVIPFFASYINCFVAEGCEQPKNSFWVVQIDTTTDAQAINLLGKIEVEDTPLRSVRIGNNLFTVSATQVQAVELLNPENTFDDVYIGRTVIADYVSIDGDDGETELEVLDNDHVDENAVIVEVSDPTRGGSVTIAEDGKSVLYTPPSDNTVRYENFDYVVEVDGIRKSANVSVSIHRENARDRMIRLAKANLIERLALDRVSDRIRLVSAEYVEWSDSCLGLADASDVCAQVITPGYKITFQHALTDIVYHTDTNERVELANDPNFETKPVVHLTARIVDSNGEAVTSLFVGQEAILQVYADDVRSDAEGVFAAYFDVVYDASLVEHVGAVFHGEDFINGQSGLVTEDGLVDEVGGFTTETTPETNHVVSIPFVAGAAGELQFSLDPADIAPEHDVLLLGVDDPIPHELIAFGDVSIQVVDEMHNEVNPGDVNMDNETSALDVLLIVNHINEHGAGRIDSEAAASIRAAASDANATRFAMDVNRDGFVTPIDALIIINGMRAADGVTAEGESSDIDSVLTSASVAVRVPNYIPLSLADNPSATNDDESAEEAVVEAVAPQDRRLESTEFTSAIDEVATTVSRQSSGRSTSQDIDDYFAELADAGWSDSL